LYGKPELILVKYSDKISYIQNFLLFELFPQQDDGVNPLPLLPAIESVSSPKPLSPEHLMGPPVTPFALSQGPAMFPPAPFYQRLPAKIF
jgi:hypothetical protein